MKNHKSRFKKSDFEDCLETLKEQEARLEWEWEKILDELEYKDIRDFFHRKD